MPRTSANPTLSKIKPNSMASRILSVLTKRGPLNAKEVRDVLPVDDEEKADLAKLTARISTGLSQLKAAGALKGEGVPMRYRVVDPNTRRMAPRVKQHLNDAEAPVLAAPEPVVETEPSVVETPVEAPLPPQAEQPATPPPVLEPMAQPAMVPPHHSTDLGAALSPLMRAIAAAVAQDFAEQLRLALLSTVADLTAAVKSDVEHGRDIPSPAQLAQQVAEAIKPPKHRKPSVLVAGLIPQQIQLISKEFGDELDVRFWRQGDSMEMLKHNARNADHAIAFSGKVGHSVAEAIQSVRKEQGLNRVPLERCHGGLSALRTKLTTIYVQR